MRVTTQMLNESAKRAGLPIMQDSLLNHLSGSGESGSLVEALSEKNKKAEAKTAATKYEKTQKAADGLDNQLKKFTLEGSGNIFEKIKDPDHKEELYKEITALADQYNVLLDAMKQNSGTMDTFYRQSLADVARENKEALSTIGISVDGSGKLKVDQEKLKAASPEAVEKVLGSGSRFASQLSFLTSRIADHAAANVESVSGTYLPGGGMANDYRNSHFDYFG